MPKLTHLDSSGQAHMVDVGIKSPSHRKALARARVLTTNEVIEAIRTNAIKKGDVLATARIAGIFAIKSTSTLIPLCHPLRVDLAEIHFELQDDCVEILCSVEAFDRTGVEMEAMTGASVAALTLYDMCKSVDRSMTIDNIQLLTKSGGKSGNFHRNSPERPSL